MRVKRLYCIILLTKFPQLPIFCVLVLNICTKVKCCITAGKGGVLISFLTYAKPTQMAVFLSHSPHPSNHSQPFLPQLGDEKQWIYIWRVVILFSLLHRVFVPHSLPCAAMPLVAGKWTKAPLNRLMHSVKARGLDLFWRGETQFISAPDQLPAKRTSHPISRRLQHKKTRVVCVCAGVCVCWVVGREEKVGEVGLEGEGLVGREVLMDFRLVSQFLFTPERWGEKWDKEEKQTPNAQMHTKADTRTHTPLPTHKEAWGGGVA